MTLHKVAAFSDRRKGGNPAGVAVLDTMPDEKTMQAVARQVGYSETAFLAPHSGGWRIRYFSPEVEVPFCGHATIASGAVLGSLYGEGRYTLFLNTDAIAVAATKSGDSFGATLTSPRTWSEPASEDLTAAFLARFHLSEDDLDPAFPVRIAFAGARHLILMLKEKSVLEEMAYDFDPTKELMLRNSLTTISLLWKDSDDLFRSRNAFAAGGVYEDPATGAAAAAFGGYLRDIQWKRDHRFSILQGQEMGYPSRLEVTYTAEKGAGISISGQVRPLEDPEIL